MECKNLYTNVFSEIGFGIQPFKIVNYNVCYDGMYGVEIVEKSGVFTESDIVYISKDKYLVIDIIKYLHEHAIDIISCRDVVNDLLTKVSAK